MPRVEGPQGGAPSLNPTRAVKLEAETLYRGAMGGLALGLLSFDKRPAPWGLRDPLILRRQARKMGGPKAELG